MATEKQIARAFVEFTEKGIEEYSDKTNKAVRATEKVTDAAGKAEKASKKMSSESAKGMKDAGRSVDDLHKKIERLVGRMKASDLYAVAKAFTFGGGLGLGGIFAGAARGSNEMERFGYSLEQLMRKLGAGFAPIVRGATMVLDQLAKEWMALSPAQRDAAFNFGLWTTGISAAVVAIPTLIIAVEKLRMSIIGLAAAGKGLPTLWGALGGGGAAAGGGLAGGALGRGAMMGGGAAAGAGMGMGLAGAGAIGLGLAGVGMIGYSGWLQFTEAGQKKKLEHANWIKRQLGLPPIQMGEVDRPDANAGDVSRFLPLPGQAAKPGGFKIGKNEAKAIKDAQFLPGAVKAGDAANPDVMKQGGGGAVGGMGGALGRIVDAFMKGYSDKSPFHYGQAQYEGPGDIFWRQLKAGQTGSTVDVEKLQLDALKDISGEMKMSNKSLAVIANRPVAFAR